MKQKSNEEIKNNENIKMKEKHKVLTFLDNFNKSIY